MLRISSFVRLLGQRGRACAATLPICKTRHASTEPMQDSAACRDDRAEVGADHRFNRGSSTRCGCHQRAGGVTAAKIEVIIRDTQGRSDKA